MNKVGFKKGSLQSEENFLDVDCLCFGNAIQKYMLLRHVEQSFFLIFCQIFGRVIKNVIIAK